MFKYFTYLLLQDATRSIPLVRNTLDYVKELNTIVRSSAKRHAIFEKIRNRLLHDNVDDEHDLESIKTMSSTSSRGCHSLRQLCPTRWTVKGDAMQSVLDNYEAVLLCLEEIAQEDKAEAGSKASGLANIFTNFDTFCGLQIGALVFQQAEQLSRLLQKKSLVANAAKAAAQILISSLADMRSEHFFHNFWLKITQLAIDLKLEHPQVPRSRRPSSFLDSGAPPAQFADPESFYRVKFYTFLDCVINFVSERFQQPSFDIYVSAEQLMLHAATSDSWSNDVDNILQHVVNHFGSDVDGVRLGIQLKMLPMAVNADGSKQFSQLSDVIDALISLGNARDMFCEVNKLIRLLLTIPASSSTAERSFSALRRLKSYTRSTMSAARLNHLAILHIHKDLAAEVRENDIGNMFVSGVESRVAMYGAF
jgi:hypothetical protein